MFSNDTHEKIEAYLNDTMSIADRADFEKELNNNPELAEEVEINRQMLLNYDEYAWGFFPKNSRNPDARAVENYLNSEEARVLSDTISLAKDRYKAQNSSIRRKTFFYYAAASVVILLLAGNFFINVDTPESLYNDYRNWETLPSQVDRGKTTTTLSRGEQLFKQKKYAEAIAVFETYREEHGAALSPQTLMYLGASYIESGQYGKAMTTFDQLLNSNTLDSESAYWYKALTYLKQGDKEKAKLQLEFILLNPELPYFEKAQELMGKLK
ncbi:MAG: tetratricopeptide repeat protein [Sinomicrobium sp.]|nr:tetratricopeptide repeat protein [Sinomicrobium sp.]